MLRSATKGRHLRAHGDCCDVLVVVWLIEDKFAMGDVYKRFVGGDNGAAIFRVHDSTVISFRWHTQWGHSLSLPWAGIGHYGARSSDRTFGGLTSDCT